MNSRFQSALRAGEEAGSPFKLLTPRECGTTGSGNRTGSRSGQSIDFRDYRDYQLGDDLRTIDWNVYARTDKLTVKLFHEEVTPHLDIILDTSKSMDLPETSKAEAALTVAGIFGAAAGNAGCTCRPWCSGDDGIVPPPHFAGLPGGWVFHEFESIRTMDESWGISPPALRPMGVRVVISDLLWPGEPDRLLRMLSERSAKLIVVQVPGAVEVNPPERGNMRLIDSETGEKLEVFLDESARAQYMEGFEAHVRLWRDACRKVGAVMVQIEAEAFLNSRDLSPFEETEILGVI